MNVLVTISRSYCNKNEYFILEQVQDKKITGLNGSHFLYLYGDFYRKWSFLENGIKNSKICLF